LLESAASIALALAGHFEQFLDQPGGLEFVEGFDGLAESFLGQRFDLGFVDLMLVHNFEDQVFLFNRAIPVLLGALAVSVAVAFGVAIAPAVVGDGQESNVFDGTVDAFLEQLVEPGTFRLHLGQVGDFGPERDAELVRGILGQTQFLTVIAF